jgi:hypothetical protein
MKFKPGKWYRLKPDYEKLIESGVRSEFSPIHSIDTATAASSLGTLLEAVYHGFTSWRKCTDILRTTSNDGGERTSVKFDLSPSNMLEDALSNQFTEEIPYDIMEESDDDPYVIRVTSVPPIIGVDEV